MGLFYHPSDGVTQAVCDDSAVFAFPDDVVPDAEAVIEFFWFAVYPAVADDGPSCEKGHGCSGGDGDEKFWAVHSISSYSTHEQSISSYMTVTPFSS